MRKLLILVALIFCLGLAGCEDTNIGLATDAARDAVQAIALDEEDVARLSLDMAGRLDQENTLAPPEDVHARRLNRLLGASPAWRDRRFDVRVYLSPQVNAFALANGSVRIHSGLMERMDDGELLFVVGHEMGHVLEGHVTEKLRLAYAGSAVRKAIASQGGDAGAIAGSVLGALAEALVNAQFSQHEERQADDHGLGYILGRGLPRQVAVSALLKLAALGNDHSFLSSHPAPEARARRLQEVALSPDPGPTPSLWERVLDRARDLWPLGWKGDKAAALAA